MFDVIVIGAGAAGLMCAGVAGQKGRRVLLLDHAKKVGEKIRISGGGRCNFTNIHTSPSHFLSANPHFCKSALSRYTPQDFMQMVARHKIGFHEKKLGQLFCNDSATQIIQMLLDECAEGGVTLKSDTRIETVRAHDGGYKVTTPRGTFCATSLVIATGGLSIPKIGATKFGYEIARQFGLDILPTRAGLVPLTFQNQLLQLCQTLTGLAVDATVSCDKTSFCEGLLFTHRGLSGPSILQISSYWREGAEVRINLNPEMDSLAYLKEKKASQPKQEVHTALAHIVPKRLAQALVEAHGFKGRLADKSHKQIHEIAMAIHNWRIKPNGTEGYRTAEVTLGGVDTRQLSSKTMECKNQMGLYFIGEVVDVTGHLGGFNFQWAWASGYAAGMAV